jgi:broad specificity phosphatase PhoE
MSADMPKLYLARHGDTAWTDSHQHTGRTDLPLNEQGEQHAQKLGGWLRQFSFTRVFTSPLLRASKTCELAGFGVGAEADHDLEADFQDKLLSAMRLQFGGHVEKHA